ncbi:hypothetical protein CDAR_24671 [Caerostris darwini]|uniref:Uncharacterized protein n=1 Tax=Caerostris darwini TaxID=1538125 RepID=A0AAV4QCL7_9ARAC|nr:hypothetical protein CDAR_24671 [Caerostris darwini]
MKMIVCSLSRFLDRNHHIWCKAKLDIYWTGDSCAVEEFRGLVHLRSVIERFALSNLKVEFLLAATDSQLKS